MTLIIISSFKSLKPLKNLTFHLNFVFYSSIFGLFPILINKNMMVLM